MTNEQLAIVLSGYLRNLKFVVEGIKNGLPAECNEPYTNMLGIECCDFPILKGLENSISGMEKDIDLLTGDKQ